MRFAWAFKMRVRVSRYRRTTDCTQCSKSTDLSNTTSQGIVPLTMGGHLEYVLWEFRQPNTHSESINKRLVDEIMDLPGIIYRNSNYVENLHATCNNENKNIIFIQHFYIPIQNAKNHRIVNIFLHPWNRVNLTINFQQFYPPLNIN